jgi:hypothetical protein
VENERVGAEIFLECIRRVRTCVENTLFDTLSARFLPRSISVGYSQTIKQSKALRNISVIERAQVEILL